MPFQALFILVLGMLTTWLAAGSLGYVAPPLQKALTWLAFASLVMAALPSRGWISRSDLSLLGGAVLIAVMMTASPSAAINTLGVAVLLAAIAQLRPESPRWPTARVAGPAALAAVTLAVFRLVCESSAAAWVFTNHAGHIEGVGVAWLTGRPLQIGASFGGIDFLVVMAALTVAWLVAAPRPRLCRALLAIFVAQTAYLVIVAFSDDLAALLPPIVTPHEDRLSHLGVWSWGNALRTLLPWNLPLLAGVFHSAVAAGMFGLIRWTTASNQPTEPDETSIPARSLRNRNLPAASKGPDRPGLANWQLFGPAGLLIVAAVAMTYAPAQPDLKNRHVVAYDDGFTDWTTSDPGAVPPGSLPRYGLLPVLVQSLGGDFIRSRELTEADLGAADVLVIVPSKASARAASPGLSEELRKRIWRYVADGGRLIVGGDPETSLGIEENSMNALLAPAAISYRDDTANSLTERWEDNLLAAPHAATASSNPGRGSFSFDRAASLRVAWSAGPLLVGRWAWDEVGTDPDRPEALSYVPGNHLGDLVLAAQQKFGKGTVVALNAAACLSNDGIPFSYTFTAPMISALAADASTPLAWWRQVLGIAAAGGAIGLLFLPAAGRAPSTIGATAATLALASTLLVCAWINDVSGRLLPSGTKTTPQPVIYVDGSHLEGMGKNPWNENGAGRLMRILADNGYLPLVAPDVSLDRLKQAAMLISIAPGEPFSSSQIAAVKQFLTGGGVFLSMVGSPDAEPSRPLLEELNLHINPMPVPPWVRDRETTPGGNFRYPNDEQAAVEFYGAWPVSGAAGGVLWPPDNPDPDKRPVLGGSTIGQGQAYLLGDSSFGLKKNLDGFSPNPRFWETQLRTWLGHEPPPPQAGPPNTASANKPAPNIGTPNTGMPKNTAANTGPIPGLPKPTADKGAAP
jgi:hypothetical protein